MWPSSFCPWTSSVFSTFHAKNYFDPTDEPSQQIPFMYHYANRPGLSTQTSRQVIAKSFNTAVDGLPGNDGEYIAIQHIPMSLISSLQILVCCLLHVVLCCWGRVVAGAMGSFAAFLLAGLYPIPATRQFLLSSPFFAQISFNNPVFNKTTTIRSNNFAGNPDNGAGGKVFVQVNYIIIILIDWRKLVAFDRAWRSTGSRTNPTATLIGMSLRAAQPLSWPWQQISMSPVEQAKTLCHHPFPLADSTENLDTRTTRGQHHSFINTIPSIPDTTYNLCCTYIYLRLPQSSSSAQHTCIAHKSI